MRRTGTDIRREAADWVVVLQGPPAATDAELRRFRAWLLRSPAHVEAYLKAETVWLALQSADRKREIDIDALLHDSGNVVALPTVRIAPEGGAAVDAPTGVRWRWVAGLALVPLLGLLLWQAWPAQTRIRTVLGEQHTTVLSDGSALEVNTQSDVRIAYTRTARNVELVAGEAYFNVRKDPSRPFVVAVNNHEVTAVGTEFNVYKRQADAVVTVTEGVVELTSRDARDRPPLRVSAGGQATITDSRIDVADNAAAIDRAIAWRKNQLVSLAQPVDELVAEINRYNQHKIVIDDDALRERRISGVFSVHSPELVVQFLARSAPVTVVETADGSWVISARARPAADGP